MSEFVPAEPIHPGEFVRDELDERGLTQTDLADITGLSRRLINGILAGKASVTPAVAVALGQVFDTSDEAWLKLQSLHDLAAARKEEDDIARKAAIYARVPVREIARRGWIDFDKSISTDALEASVCSLLGTGGIAEVPPFTVAARKSTD